VGQEVLYENVTCRPRISFESFTEQSVRHTDTDRQRTSQGEPFLPRPGHTSEYFDTRGDNLDKRKTVRRCLCCRTARLEAHLGKEESTSSPKNTVGDAEDQARYLGQHAENDDERSRSIATRSICALRENDNTLDAKIVSLMLV